MPPKRGKKAAAVPAKPPLDGCIIALSGSFKDDNNRFIAQSKLREMAEGAGATVANVVGDDTTHLVATEIDYNKPSTKVLKAKGLGIHVVGLDWLKQSAQENTRKPEKDFALAIPHESDANNSQATKNDDQNNVSTQPDNSAPTTRKRKRGASPAPDTASAPDTSTNGTAPAAKAKAKPRARKGAVKAEEDEEVQMDDADAAPEPEVKEKKPVPVIGEGQVLKRKDVLVPVDEYCPYTTSKVYVDDDGVVYDAALNQTNASNNNNKFYRVQVLIDPTGIYRCWTRWGRVGEKGQTATPAVGSLAYAMVQFEKKFKDKSGLAWSKRGDNPKPGKYAFVERNYTDSDDEDDDDADATKDGKGKEKEAGWEPPASKLPPSVQELMKLIFNAQLFATTMASLNYDSDKLPLGRLSKGTIMRGFQALKDLSALLDDSSLAANYGRPFHAAVEQLSNTFYSVIPHAFGRERPPIINQQSLLKREIELLESLSDMKEASNIMKLDKSNVDDVHPLDRQFKGLNLEEMTPLDPTSAEFTNLAAYLNESRGHTHGYSYTIESIFRIERQGEVQRLNNSPYAKMTSNRRLLWHGSRVTNFGGILSQGLRIAPPEAPVTGYMFGKGIYLADMSSKSAGYCFSGVSKGNALLLLCEAELGDPMQELTDASSVAAETAKANGMISTWGKGMNGPFKWKDASCVNPSLAGVQMVSTVPKKIYEVG